MTLKLSVTNKISKFGFSEIKMVDEEVTGSNPIKDSGFFLVFVVTPVL